MSEAPPNGVVYFHYNQSPYARRVAWYLAFRRIAYAECIQPRIMPRPDLKALGVQYRRTPTLAIGRDIYVDSRMIIYRLEEHFPASEQHPRFSTKETAGLAALLNKFVVDGSVFSYAAQIFRPDLPIFRDEAFMKDRSAFSGRTWSAEAAKKQRPEALVHVRQSFEILETLLGDGRDWVGGTDKPTLADLEGVWPIDWIISDLSPPEDLISEKIYPKVYGWRNRFMAALKAAKAAAPKVVRLKGPDAVSAVLAADFTDKDLVVDTGDPIQLKEGTKVKVFPTDSGGLQHQDSGRLIKLTKDEVAIAVQSEKGDKEIHIHAPRWKFKIAEIGGSRL